MGNCLRREKSMVWAGDDWESLAPKNIHRHAEILYDDEEETDNDIIVRERLLGEECSKSTGTTTSSTREVVKIKMTKKQLEELVGRSSVLDMKAAGLSSVEQVLAHLVMMKKSDGADDYYEMRRDQHSSWRPVLQSIPEVN